MVKFTSQPTQEPIEDLSKLASTRRVEANTKSLGAVLQFSVCLAFLSFGWTNAIGSPTFVSVDLGHGQDPNTRFQRVPEHPRSFLPGRAETF